MIAAGMKNGEILPGPPRELRVLALDDVESADARSDVDAGGIGVSGVTSARPCACRNPRRPGQLNEPGHLLEFFFFDPVEGIETRALHRRCGSQTRWTSKWVMGPIPLLPARRLVQTSSVPMPQTADQPNTRHDNSAAQGKTLLLERGRSDELLLALACFSMYSMASFTVAIFSASSSGISMPKASSKAITSSTVSSESAPRSSTNEAVK
jgi:hypothetical protein